MTSPDGVVPGWGVVDVVVAGIVNVVSRAQQPSIEWQVSGSTQAWADLQNTFPGGVQGHI